MAYVATLLLKTKNKIVKICVPTYLAFELFLIHKLKSHYSTNINIDPNINV